MKNLRLGIIGAGTVMRERHWPNLKNIPGVSLSCVCNSSPQSAEKFLLENGICADVETDWRRVIERNDVDVVWIAAPPMLHKPTVIESIKARKPVFCQARMAANFTDAKEMYEAHRRAPDVVAAFCPAPYGMSISRFVKKILSDGILGKIYHLELSALSNVYCNPDAPAHWRQRREINGINFLTCGIFAEVILDWFGEPNRLCASGKIVHQERGRDVITLPDFISVLAEWRNGLRGTFTWSGVHFGEHRPKLTVQGTKSAMQIWFQPDEIFLSQSPNTAPAKISVPKEYISEWNVERDFIDAVRGLPVKPGITFEEGLRYMRFTQAVIDSFESNGVWIELNSYSL